MKAHRVFAIALRFVLAMKYSLERLTDSFYWPIIDLFIWGLTSRYLQTVSGGNIKIMVGIISGLLFWLIVWRAQYEIGMNLLGDIWNRNLINIFVSPLNFWEWISAFVILGLVKAFLSFSFASVVAYFLYKVHVFIYGFYFVPFVILLLMTGWWIGFTIVGCILVIGRRVEAFAWTLGSLIIPFSAVYYPVSILPLWAQRIAHLIPTSYVFEAAREILHSGTYDFNKILTAFFLNLLYIVLSLLFMKKAFDRVMLNRGMVNIY
ncbi:ABC transporter permease [Candidatus Roizmanbacteria bacterium]|nr:ABC transporter permease [Candidatus Roizmanbacteria bacterium]